MSEQKDFFFLHGNKDVASLERSTNFILQRIADRLDQLEGLRGQTIFYGLDYIIKNGGTLTFGDGTTDGSWRLYIDGTDYKLQVLKNKVWTDTTDWLYADY